MDVPCEFGIDILKSTKSVMNLASDMLDTEAVAVVCSTGVTVGPNRVSWYIFHSGKLSMENFQHGVVRISLVGKTFSMAYAVPFLIFLWLRPEVELAANSV